MPVLYETIQRGWNVFGAPLVLACYFSSLITSESDSNKPPNIWIFLAIGTGIVLVVGTLTEAYSTSVPLSIHQTLRPMVTMGFIWHRMLLLLLDICLFFIFSQSLSKKRNSPMHVPSEMAYIPAILAIFFILPRILGRVSRPSTDRPPSNNTDSDWVLTVLFMLLFTLPSFVLVLVYKDDDNHLSKDIQPGFQIVIFILLVFIYSFHARNLTFTECEENEEYFQSKVSRSRRLSTAISSILKATVLCLGIFFFRLHHHSPTAALEPSIKRYDYYTIRSVTQDPNSPLFLQHTKLPLFSPQNLSRIFYSIHIRSTYILCGGKWFLDLRDASYQFIWNSNIDRRVHETDIHDLHLAFLIFTILVSLFGASIGIDYNSPTPTHITTPTHSVEILWSVLIASLVLLGITGAVAFKRIHHTRDAIREPGKDA